MFSVARRARAARPPSRSGARARPALASLAIGHEALRRAEDRDPQSIANARDLRRGDVLAKPGRRNALQLAEYRLDAGVLGAHAQQLPPFLALEGGEILNEVVVLQDAGDLDF